MKEKFLFLKKVTDKAFWKKVHTCPEYEFFIDDLLASYEAYCQDEIKEIPYRLFKQFFINGNRINCEQVYFERRERLNTCALLSMIYPDNEEYFEKLQDIIWAICNEYSWALPAHLGLSKKTGQYDEENIRNEFNLIDLFASETAAALAEIKLILNDRLDEDIKNRISSEIDRRVIVPYLNDNYFWETIKSNWAAVCAGNVGSTFIYERPDLFPQIKERLHKTLESFLSSYKEDGVCEEGVSYWEFGFGNFLFYAQTLYEFSEGKEDLLASEHVKNIASYANLIFLNDNMSLSFSDSRDTKAPVSFAVMEMLRAYYGDLIPVFDIDVYGIVSVGPKFQYSIRSLVFFDTMTEYKGMVHRDVILKKDSGLFIKRGVHYDLAATAGHNDAPHNHNDLGSFILRWRENRIFDDLGAGEYTKDYFGMDTRYNYFVCGAQGHSVPVINGQYQPPGREYRSEMSYDGDTLSINLSKAYNCPELSSFERKFVLSDESLSMCDIFAFNGAGNIKEQFITKTEPALLTEGIRIADALITYNQNDWNVTVSTKSFRNHSQVDETAYILVFNQKTETVTKFEMTVTDVECKTN